MDAVRRFAAIVLADLRERSRGLRFWIVLGLVGAATWGCFPAIETGRFAVGFGDGARAAYSSAWIGMVLGLMYATLLSLVGFYLVRGTLVRDFDTRVWQLLVATPMTRAGYLLAKWASHMAVFALILLVGMAVGVAAQWVRAEDRGLDLVELVKPVLLLAMPALAVTAWAAVLFDLLPWLRRTAGNVLYFFAWLLVFATLASVMDSTKSEWASTTWLSDPTGIVLASRDLDRELARSAPWVHVQQLSVGMSNATDAVRVFEWRHWPVQLRDVGGRALWLALSMLGVAVLAPALDWAAARTNGRVERAAHSGRRLRWLDRVLRPLDALPHGSVLAAELRLVLRQRRAWWWLALAVLGLVQAFGSREAVGVAAILAWLASADVFARAVLRERDGGTAALLFANAGALRRLLVARVGVALLLATGSVVPALLHLAREPAAVLALLLAAGTVALGGLALGAVCRSPRPFELLLVAFAYAGAQGQGPLAVLGAPGMWAQWHALAWPVLGLAVLAMWPRMAGGAHRLAGA